MAERNHLLESNQEALAQLHLVSVHTPKFSFDFCAAFVVCCV